MRYPPEHKARVRERIVQAASRQFRRRAGAGIAIDDLMRDLKLTRGGFYRHFAGKDELFNEAFLTAAAEARGRMCAAAENAPPGRALEAIVNTYLSASHCASPEQGCPIAALAAEVSQRPKSTRAALDAAIRDNAAAIERFMPGRTSADRALNAIVLFSGMAGTLTLARAAADARLRQQILDAARTFYLQLARGSS